MILTSKKLTKNLWVEFMNIAYYIVDQVYLRPETKHTPYELFKVKKLTMEHFRIFSSTFYILKDKKDLAKFDARSVISTIL